MHAHRTRSPNRPGPIPIAVIAITVLLSVLLLPSASRADAPSLDWDALPSTPLAAPDGFTVVGCGGAFLCVDEAGEVQGAVEHQSSRLATIIDVAADLDAGVDVQEALASEISRFLRSIRDNRAETCPPTYQFRLAPTVGATVAGLEGLRYGFSVLGQTGELVEMTIGFMVLRPTADGGELSVLAATEINAGACVDSTGMLPFTSGGLGRFAPTLAGIAAVADLGEGSVVRAEVAGDLHLTAIDAVDAAIVLADLAAGEHAVDTVLVARDDDGADALASGPAQGALDAPLLLTGSDELDPRVAAAITHYEAAAAVVLGGPAAVSDAVVQDLAALGLQVRRIGGADRIGTALAIADAVAPLSERVVLARAYGDAEDPSRAWGDALAAGALAADAAVPLLLTGGEALDERVVDWLAGRAVEEVVVMGGPAAIAQPVLQRIVEEGVAIAVLDGADRAETAVLAAYERQLRDAEHAASVVLVDGRSWPDGLAATLLAHRIGAPILVADGAVLSPATLSFLAGADPADRPGLICAAGVTTTACAAAADALQGLRAPR